MARTIWTMPTATGRRQI